MVIKTQADKTTYREAGALLSRLSQKLSALIKPGLSSLLLDEEARRFTEEVGAKPSFLGYQGYPASICVSINHQVVHSIPTAVPFREGDLVSVDLGLWYRGFHVDMAFSQGVGEIDAVKKALLATTHRALLAGVRSLRAGVKVQAIGRAIEKEVNKAGFRIVPQFTGHGIGRELHEQPWIPNLAHPPKVLGEVVLPEGSVVALEPIVAAGQGEVITLQDGWTTETKDKQPACHFEVTALVGEKEAEILTPLP